MSFNKTAIGIFQHEPAADDAIARLLGSGFSSEDISALVPRRSGADVSLEKHTKAPEGAVVGASAGAIAAGIAGTLVGLGAVTIPGLGVLLAAGPIVAALTGAAAGAAVGGLGGALIGLGIPELEAKRYAARVAEGHLLVAVHTESSEHLDRAQKILQQAGAHEVTALGEQQTGSYETGSAKDAGHVTRETAASRVPAELREDRAAELHEDRTVREQERALRAQERARHDDEHALREEDTGRWMR